MCTIGYHKELNIIFKNRDKTFETEEEIIADNRIIACRTQGDNYYSWGVNRYGCAFVSAAINTPKWTRLMNDGRLEEANDQYQSENEGLLSPMILISEMLSEVKHVESWLEKLESSNHSWMAYNLLVTDIHRGFLIELHKEECHIRELNSREVVTNHFNFINHGPVKDSEYPSSFGRFNLGNERVARADSIEDIHQLLSFQDGKDGENIWREGIFSTVSSSIINFQKSHVSYAKSPHENYSHVSLNCAPQDVGLVNEDHKRFEMSRYIDLELYHEVERSHAYYIEMVDKVCDYIQKNCDPDNRYRLLELGAGTGLCTEELLKLPFLEVSALEIDVDCCKLLGEHLRDREFEVIHGDAITFCREGYYDFVVSTFAHDHIHYDKAEAFAGNIRRNLKKGGAYLMGGEFLPHYSNMEERALSLYRYHGFIVDQALREGHYRLAQIEINALESGVDMVGDFKRNEILFEKEMASAGFRLIEKNKMGPAERDDVGGIFVYIYGA